MNRDTKNLMLAVAGTAASMAAAQAGAQTRQVIFAENFDGVMLQQNVFEGIECCSTQGVVPNAWSPSLPAGWTEEFFVLEVLGPGIEGDSQIVVPDSTVGVTEWRGWSLADEDFWVAADDQRRAEFRDGFAEGAVLVADPDEWDDDLGIANKPAGLDSENTDPDDGIPSRFYNATATSPAISLAGATANTVEVNFFSSWRPEDTQRASVEVSFDGGPWEVIRAYSSDAGSPDFVGNLPNEAVTIAVNNPQGATSMQIRFRMLDARNDWWFAVDDVFISAETTSGVVAAPGWFFLDLPEFNETTIPTLNFDAIGATMYAVEIASDAAFSDLVLVDTTTEPGYTVPNGALQPGVYFARVTASNDSGERESLGGGRRFAVDNLCAFDFDGDNQTTINDLLIFVDRFRDGCVPPIFGEVIYTEDFESVVLGPNVDEAVAGAEVFSATPPAGWTVDNSLVPAGGVTEFRGWTFLDNDWWAQTAGDQRRTEFTNAIGTVAVADGDEWDDLPRDPGTMTTLLQSPALDISTRAAGSLSLGFDYSWRPEDAQEASVEVRYDGGAWQPLFSLTTANSVDSVNERVVLPLNNPSAGTLEVRFGYLNAGNNWWWAIDNVKLFAN